MTTVVAMLDEASDILFVLYNELVDEGQEDTSLIEEIENARALIEASLSKIGGSKYA